MLELSLKPSALGLGPGASSSPTLVLYGPKESWGEPMSVGRLIGSLRAED